MTILLIIVYGLACCYGIRKMAFIRRTGLKPAVLLLLFGVHVAAGWAHNAIAYRYFPEHGDVWFYYRMSFLYRHRLFHDFNQFLSDNSRFTYVSHNGVIYVQLLLNLLSFGRMSVNTLLFSFPLFLGNVALFRVFRDRFPRDLLTQGAVFLLPSVVFWTSVIYREGVLYLLLGFFLFNVNRLLTRGYTARNLGYCVLCFGLITFFRGSVGLALLPAVWLWWLLEKPAAWKPLLAAAFVVLFSGILALTLSGYDLASAIAERQHEFYVLEGHSRLALPFLDGTWSSIFHALPAAVLNALFEPLPGSGGQPIYLFFAVELLLIWLIVVLSIVRAFYAGAPRFTAYSLFCLVFSILGMLSIGLIVPFAGAIVRYRSICLPFLLAPFLHSLVGWKPLRLLNDRLINALTLVNN